jgi:hypothetical protein
VDHLPCQERSSDGGRGLNGAEEKTNKIIFARPRGNTTARRHNN